MEIFSLIAWFLVVFAASMVFGTIKIMSDFHLTFDDLREIGRNLAYNDQAPDELVDGSQNEPENMVERALLTRRTRTQFQNPPCVHCALKLQK